MDAQKITAADFLSSLNAADPATADYKTFAMQVIDALTASEANIAGLQKMLEESKANEKAAVDSAAGMKESLEQLQADYDKALDEITELGTKLDLQEKNKDTKGILVSIGGVNKILLPGRFITPKGEMTAEQVAKDEDTLKVMLAKGSGSLIDPES